LDIMKTSKIAYEAFKDVKGDLFIIGFGANFVYLKEKNKDFSGSMPQSNDTILLPALSKFFEEFKNSKEKFKFGVIFSDFQLGKEDIKDVIENIEKNLKFVTKLYIITTDNYSGDYDKIIAHFNEFHKHKVKVINLSEQKAKFEKELRDILVDIVKDIVDFLQSKSISP